MIIRQRANTLRSRDRVETTMPLTAGAGPPRTYAGVAAGRTVRAGGGAGSGGPGFATRESARKGQQQQQSVGQRSVAGRKGGAVGGSESRPGAARATTKGVTSMAVTELLSRISEVSSVWGKGPLSPLAEEPTVSAAPPTSTKSRGATSGTEAEAPSKQPKSSSRRTRRKKGSRAVIEKNAAPRAAKEQAADGRTRQQSPEDGPGNGTESAFH